MSQVALVFRRQPSRPVAPKLLILTDLCGRYGIEWRKHDIWWYVDGTVYCHAELAADAPQVPMYWILDTSVGGTWAGSPDHTDEFPTTHRIDRVAVYSDSDW